MCGLAARHDALPRNTVKDARSTTQPRRATARSLTLAQVRQLHAVITYDNTAVARDLPDSVAFMLATGLRDLAPPAWCVEVLQHRARGLHASGVTHSADPVFPAPKGGLRDPSNTHGDLRETLAWCGLSGITSHIFRKTTTTLLDNAGLSARTIAGHLGHAQPSVTQNVYMGRKIASTKASTVLQQLA